MTVEHFDMRIFLAGATGVIGRQLVPLLVRAGHRVTGATRVADKAAALTAAGAEPVVVDVYDAGRLTAAVMAARPDVVIHQLTDLPQTLDPGSMAEALARNARLRIEGTANLMAAARAAKVRRMVAQSIAFVYATGRRPHVETDPLQESGGPAGPVATLERLVTTTPGIAGVVLRYGRLYGPGTWAAVPTGPGFVHVDAAAHAALLAVTKGDGIYNIAEDDADVSIAKARAELGFDPHFRLI
jgi:nucleoside-diphosphate-sugar epimerase